MYGWLTIPDPLIFTLMEDPVILPASQMTIDRATIRSHLLSDPNDPFNRVPLKIEDVTPSKSLLAGLWEWSRLMNRLDTELKDQIEAFKAERVAERRRALTQQQGEPMDTST